MCIICVKPRGAKLPTEKTLKAMFSHNPHGAGIMYAADGHVAIRKGFMTYGAFRKALKQFVDHIGEDEPLVMHFRITTHGGTCPENTHPFPLTDDMDVMHKTHVLCSLGIAHNGIIRITPRDKDASDTMEYIASVIMPMAQHNKTFYRDQRCMDAIRDTINGSRMVFMDSNGDTYRVGNWIEDGGCWYSNDSFRTEDTRWISAPHTDVHTRSAYESVRLPWERHASMFAKLMPIEDDIVRDSAGFTWTDYCLAIDAQRRLYEIDIDEGIACETGAYAKHIRYNRDKAIYFQIA